MAAMFYSLKEAAEKLNMTEEQIQQLVKDGKIREFRDGANVLLKAEEVNALTKQEQSPKEPANIEQETQASASPSKEAAGPEQPEEEPAEVEPEEISLESEEPAKAEKPAEEPKAKIPTQPEKEKQQKQKEQQRQEDKAEAEEIDLETEQQEKAKKSKEKAPEKKAEVPKELADADDISLAEAEDTEDTKEATAFAEELVDEDTLGGSEEINLDSGTGELAAQTKGSGDEESLEEIEEDVNLDSFGSGSGLLDLSLQADDTSLGGVLDEIYTSEGEQDTTEGPALEMEQEQPEEVPSEESGIVESEAAAPAAPLAMSQARAEAAPDTLSNALGLLLFLPILAIAYTAIVAIGGFNDMMPSVLAKLQAISGPVGVHIIWFVVLGLIVLCGIGVALAYVLGGGAGTGGKKKKAEKN